MSGSVKKKLFFIKSPSHNLKLIEIFLRKRDFIVNSETDLQKALAQVIELESDFIFLAWDHTDPTVVSLPKSIIQASLATIIPYIMSTKKEDIAKFHACTLNPKIYPPLLGPAIERLVLKLIKKADQDASISLDGNPTDNTEDKSNTDLPKKRESEMIHLKSSPSVDYGTKGNSYQTIRNTSINKKNNILKQSKKLSLPEKVIDGLKNSAQEKIQQSLTSLLSSLQESEDKISVESDSAEISRVATKDKEHIRVYCMSVLSDNWCGYLLINTTIELDFSMTDIIFTEWIKLQFDNLQEVDEQDYFELENINFNVFDQLTQKADYSESCTINKDKLSVSFFSVDPSKMAVELSDSQDLIKAPTQDIPTDAELKFSLYLYLPENKKYLLYTPATKALAEKQKTRLLANNILSLYIPLDFEKDYKKFIAEKNIETICQNIYKKFSAA